MDRARSQPSGSVDGQVPDDQLPGRLRATEELFFRDPPLFSVTSTVSTLRPDHRLNRRNAYWRMFGMDLPHAPAGVDGQPWKTDVGPTANLGFGTVWIDFASPEAM